MVSSELGSVLETKVQPRQEPAPRKRPADSAPARRGLREYLRQGVPGVWFTATMACCIVAMLVGMVGLILVNGLGHFWAPRLLQIRTGSGTFLGPVQETETQADGKTRLLLKIGNRDIHGLDFRWFDAAEISERAEPSDAVVVERTEYGDFHGYLRRVVQGDEVLGEGEAAWKMLGHEVRRSRQEREALRALERVESPSAAQEAERERLAQRLASRVAVLEAADGSERTIALDDVVRAYRPNAMTVPQRAVQYASKFWEFMSAHPRESNTEGGIFPALFGTVLMVLLMTLAVVPLGVVAALYLHEYAKQGFILRAVRLAVNNLAGVPSIVFGMFGLAFFVYGVGGFLDRTFYADALPNPTFGTGGILWASLTLALMTLPVVIVATEEGLSAVPRANREGSLALGATQWQTLWHVVLPNAMPGILTGLILAVSRGAGEVAPLMLTGVVKLAPQLAVGSSFPFLHLERKFMHLGFHIFDVSMQSPNVEAAKPMVYTTTLLLLVLVLALNATAIWMRNRMRRRYRGAAV